MIDIEDRDAVALCFAQICCDAAVEVMEVYDSDFEVRLKDDYSPVCDADERAELAILCALKTAFPGITVVAEESFNDQDVSAIDNIFILVDPVDGSKEFVNRNGEFTVNIGLVENGHPVAGCVYAPALNKIYLGGERALRGEIRPGDKVRADKLSAIMTRTPAPNGLTSIISRSHPDEKALAFAEKAGARQVISAGSSLKFCRLAEGAADIYPRFGPTMEWDIAAGHAVLRAAGGDVLKPSGEAFRYGKISSGFQNGSFIAWGFKPDEAE